MSKPCETVPCSSDVHDTLLPRKFSFLLHFLQLVGYKSNSDFPKIYYQKSLQQNLMAVKTCGIPESDFFNFSDFWFFGFSVNYHPSFF